MAIFGLPCCTRTTRCVPFARQPRCATALAGLNVTLRAGSGSLENRTGVNTGEVVAGDTGEPAPGHRRHGERRRPSGAGGPDDEVLIGEPTYRLVRDAVDVEPVEPLELKGKPEPVPAYRLLSVSARPRRHPAGGPADGRTRRRARRPRAEFRRRPPDPRVGSSRWSAMPGSASATDPRVRAGLAGEATVLRGRCLSYGDGITFWPLAEDCGRPPGSCRRTARRTPAPSSRPPRRRLADGAALTRPWACRSPVRKARAVLGRPRFLEKLARA